MAPKQIRDALKKRETTQKEIAEKLGVSEMSVSKTVHRKIVSDRIMTAIAMAIGKPKAKVFPEYYYGPKLRSTSKAFGQPENNL